MSKDGNSSDLTPAATTLKPVPKIELPHALHTPTEYPAGATGEARLLLELTVLVDGTVAEPRVLEGVEPFGRAAIAATGQWRFTSATRDGVPVPAKIRFVVHFVPQAVTSHSPVAAIEPEKPTPKVSGAPPTKAQAVEVTVKGQRPEVAVVSMGRADVEQLPGAFGDPFRALEAMPGVTPLLSGVPFFFIRGAPPGNQGYFLDGVRVPLLYHMAMGPGIVHPALVERLDLYAGGYPSHYGRFAGAIVAAETTDAPPEYHVEGNVRLVDSGAYVTAPLWRGSVALGGRYSYTAAIVSLLAPEVELDYWDYQIKTTQHLTDKDSVGLFAFGSLDLVRFEDSGDVGSLSGTEFHRVDLRYQRRFDDRSRARTALTLGLDRTLAAETLAVRDRLISWRADYERQFSSDVSFRSGADVGVDSYDLIVPVPEESESELIASLPTRKDTTSGLWADVSFKPTANITVVPGLRLDYYASRGESRLAVEPRVSALFSLRKWLRLVHAAGVAHQPPSFVIPVPGLQMSGLEDGLQRALQQSASVEMDLPHQLNAQATFFQNAFFNLTDQLSLLDSGDVEDFGTRSRGRTYGMELMLRRSFSQRIGGLFTYTLSKSWRTLNGIRSPASFDRRHVLQLALAFNLGRNWRASSRFMVYSGIPSQSDSDEMDVNGIAAARKNPEHLPRTPAFWRTDARLQKRWPVGNAGAYWALTFEALNATLNKETITQRCSSTGCRGEKVGPIAVPSIGVEAAY